MRTSSPRQLHRGKKRQWDTHGVLLDAEGLAGEVNPAKMFPEQPNLPVELEIGVGKGTFLLARARQRPKLNFLGIEYAQPYAQYAADRIRRARLANVKLLCCDASDFIKKQLCDQSLWRVHVYFPDPWPKRRHQRRRLIQHDFISHVRRVLQPGGQFLVVTDHLGYFQHMTELLTSADKGFLETNFPKILDNGEYITGTNFEKKYSHQHKPFYSKALMKYS